jgi:hypothetical protein
MAYSNSFLCCFEDESFILRAFIVANSAGITTRRGGRIDFVMSCQEFPTDYSCGESNLPGFSARGFTFPFFPLDHLANPINEANIQLLSDQTPPLRSQSEHLRRRYVRHVLKY